MSALPSKAEQLAREIGIEKLRLLPREGRAPTSKVEIVLAAKEALAEQTEIAGRQFNFLSKMKARRDRKLRTLRATAAHQRRPDLAQLAVEILLDTPFSLSVLMGPGRSAALCRVRFEYFRRATEAGYSLSEVGKFVNRDHATVIHGLRVLAREGSAS